MECLGPSQQSPEGERFPYLDCCGDRLPLNIESTCWSLMRPRRFSPRSRSLATVAVEFARTQQLFLWLRALCALYVCGFGGVWVLRACLLHACAACACSPCEFCVGVLLLCVRRILLCACVRCVPPACVSVCATFLLPTCVFYVCAACMYVLHFCSMCVSTPFLLHACVLYCFVPVCGCR